MHSTCPILDRTTPALATPYDRDDWKIVRCKETGFVYLSDPPEYDSLETDFAWEKTSVLERERRLKEEPIFSKISLTAKSTKNRLFPNRNKMATRAVQIAMEIHSRRSTSRPDKIWLLDIGCGWGRLLQKICEDLTGAGLSVNPRGIEVSKELARRANQNIHVFGGDVIQANAIAGADQLNENSVDIVLMSSFLEHECQPLRLLRSLHRSLSPEGSIIIKVPNFDCWNRKIRQKRWCGFRYPDHVNYFTPKTLRRLSREAGYTVCQQHLRDRFPLSDNMYAVLRKGV